MRKNKYLKYSLFGIIFFVLLYNFTSFVWHNSLNMPFWDEWDVAELIMQKGNWLEVAIHQHNEHRIGTGLVLMKMLAPLTSWSQLVETVVVSFEIIGSCLLLLYVKKKTTGELMLADLIFPFVFLNVLQWGNILFAFQITFVFPLVFLCLALWALTINNVAKRNVLLVIFSLLGAFSSLHGIFIPIILAFFLFAENLLNKFKNWRITLVTLIAEVLIIASYFWGYEKKLQTTISLVPNFKTFDFFSAFFANGFFFHASKSNFLGLRYSLVLLAIGFLFYGIYQLFVKKKEYLTDWIGVILITYSFLFALSITIGRAAFGVAQASETRYITFSMLAPLGIYFLLENFKRKTLLRILLIILLLVGLLSYPTNIAESVKSATNLRKEAIKCYQTKKQTEYAECFKIAPLYPDETRLNSLIPSVLEYKGNK